MVGTHVKMIFAEAVIASKKSMLLLRFIRPYSHPFGLGLNAVESQNSLKFYFLGLESQRLFLPAWNHQEGLGEGRKDGIRGRGVIRPPANLLPQISKKGVLKEGSGVGLEKPGE